MRITEIDPEITEAEYNDMITELYGSFKIGDLEFDAGDILEELDPIAFRVGKSDYEAELPVKYECGECKEEYEDRDEAENCCKETCSECGELFEPEELTGGICDTCQAAIKAETDTQKDSQV